jgi:single-strand DNA-binding protein
MADVNSVVLVGRLTRDGELKYTNNGVPLCRFSIANNYRRKVGDEWTEEASFFDCVLMGRRAEAISRYMTKGSQIGVEGELRQNRWEQDGQQRSRVEIFVNNVQFLGGRGGGGGGSGGSSAPQAAAAGGQSEYEGDHGESFEDDVPF